MSGNYLKIRDLVKFSLSDPRLIRVRDDYEGAFKPELPSTTHPSGLGSVDQTGQVQPQGLQVTIAATHSGIITRNNGFYLPDKMKKGTTSWTDNYPRPVLVHHKDGEDNIGRIYNANYIDTSGMIKDQYNLAEGLVVKNRFGKEIGIINEVLLKDFIGDKMPFGMQVDTVCSLMRDSLLSDTEYAGLGYISIVATISDKKAIEKLLDGRYLTGSVGATTDRAVCSICRQDWTEEGKCEHTPGGIYDGAKAFIIAGSLSYDEYSFVNVPADRHSKVLALHYNGIQDNIEIANDYSGRIYEVRLGFPQYDSVSKEEERMAKNKKDAVAGKDNSPEVINDSVTPEPQPTDATPKKTEAEGTGETQVADATADSNNTDGTPETSDTPDNTTVQDSVTSEESTEESLDDFLTKVIDGKDLLDEEKEKLYDMMWEDAKACLEDGEFTLEQLGVENFEDAKLSAEKRKKLAKSAFCGPNRSFPVPDCAHVTAARRLIGRYKGPGDKSTILACVSRKAKALGCNSSKKSDATETTPPQTQDASHHARMMHVLLAAIEENQWHPSDQDPALSDEDKSALASILKKLASVVGKDSFVSTLVGLELVSSEDEEQALLDEVIKNEETICKLRDEMDVLREEYASLHKDMETLQDSLVKVNAESRKAKEAHLTTLATLRDAKVENRDWTKLEDSAIDSELEVILKTVDMSKITDKLGDGMARVPAGEVDDPTGIQDNQESKPSLNIEDLKAIEQKYLNLLFSGPGGKEKAIAYIEDMKRQGRLPIGS